MKIWQYSFYFVLWTCRHWSKNKSYTVFFRVFPERLSYNYADDNTLSLHSPDYDRLISVLQSKSEILIDWFCHNCMKANPDNFDQ